MDDTPNDSQANTSSPDAIPGTDAPASVQTPQGTPLTYEETPVVPMETQTAVIQDPPRKSGKNLFVLLFFVAVVVAGMYLSGYVQKFLQGTTGDTAKDTTKTDTTGNTELSPTPTFNPADPFAGWTPYEVVSGGTRLPIAGVRYMLPSDVLSPICDGQTCVSQGTYLPGGTRFTIAPRGTGQGLRDFRGTVISDVNGTPFTTTETTVSGNTAVAFKGTFTGRTVSGYAFSAMRGVMVAVNDTMSLEINHFAPMGITADFAADDVLFEKILSSFIFPATGDKGAILAPPSTATGSAN